MSSMTLTSGQDTVWDELFEQSNFFKDFHYYLAIDVHSLTNEELQKWYVSSFLQHFEPSVTLTNKSLFSHTHAYIQYWLDW